jgi:hypothetical protein
METQGRRREDTPLGDLPDDIEPGDYWKVLTSDGERPVNITDSPSNLTGGMWCIVAPTETPGVHCGVATLTKHTVREEEDGTISVRPGDGSSNSILVEGSSSYHGYIEHGVWRTC